MARVFNNPNHPAYGPVRRVWIVLAELDLIDDAADIAYAALYRVRWDECMSDALLIHKVKESQLARLIVGRMMRIGK